MRALVLGGGGVAGVAWEIGLLHGLAEAGVDLSDADVVIGTSAGAAAGGQLTSGVPLKDLYERQLAGTSREIVARVGMKLPAAMMVAMLRSGKDAQKFRRHIGAMALRAHTLPEADRLAAIASRLPVHEWPARVLRVTAIDATTGDFVVFDRDSGVPFVEAVAASCAVPGVWPPVTIGDRRYIDGGMRSAANADLAAGAERAVVIAPIIRGGGPMPKVAAEIAALAPMPVALVSPDEASSAAFGRNALDPAVRGPAARAGFAQAATVADRVRAVWVG